MAQNASQPTPAGRGSTRRENRSPPIGAKCSRVLHFVAISDRAPHSSPRAGGWVTRRLVGVRLFVRGHGAPGCRVSISLPLREGD